MTTEYYLNFTERYGMEPWETRSGPMTGLRDMGDGRESIMSVPNYNTPVENLEYKDLLTNT